MSALANPSMKARIEGLLTSPLGDKLAAVFLVTWMTYSSVVAIRQGHHLTLTLLFAAVIVLNLQILFRRTPQRVTTNPWFWLLSVSASGHIALYGLFLTEQAPPLTPHAFNNALAVAAMLLMIWARVCMGRKFGFVPAMRGIVTHGPFRAVRHPVYAAIILLLIARFLDDASVTSLVLCIVGIALWVLKVFAEESFLRDEPEYREYIRKVRWRLVPHAF